MLYPVEGGVGEYEIELTVEIQRTDISEGEGEVGGAGLMRASGGNHSLGGIDPEHAATRDKSGQMRGESAVATAQVEDLFVAGEIQLLNQPEAPLLLL